jgi:hypothetical protein
MWKAFTSWLTTSGTFLIALVIMITVMSGFWLVGVTFMKGYQSFYGSQYPSLQVTPASSEISTKPGLPEQDTESKDSGTLP